ncbi:MAG: SufE family protein [Acidimicrobiales bacterium]|nr:SufE family protein [Acidimicrobiales bacterium]MBO0893239.1 SufE family protein [Acidimicrobiales bacterium]
MTEATGAVPAALQRIVDLFAGAPKELRLQALLEYSKQLPDLPPRLAENRGAMEQVPECQTPFFLTSEVGEDDRVTLWFDVPLEAPTTRGFAGILAAGLNGATTSEVLGLPSDFYLPMGLAEVISSLRLRGIGAILARLKRQVADQLAARERVGSPE